ncbi:putative SET domain-containing protein [Seiridium cardinale]|uniref:SET domain-containing protein n=1 Tax=Seiridium cardinale TaxID=138064 RepID=A0ABR2XJA4_9PEZI
MAPNIQDLTGWAGRQGIRLEGVEPVRVPARGICIVAHRNIKAGQEIIVVPTQAILSLHTVPPSIVERLPPDIPFHGLLAAHLALDSQIQNTPWFLMLPTKSDFAATTPFMWPEELQELLPKRARDLLKAQQVKFHSEWSMVSEAFPRMDKELFLYFWFIVNTRTFYYETPEMEKYSWENRLALVPMADLLNHADSGCQVTFSADGFTITADRTYSCGEEVCISYGEHSNDFLLAEYGFILPKNEWDQVCLDEAMIPMLLQNQQAPLEGRGHLGKFNFHPGSGACPTTIAALSQPPRPTNALDNQLRCDHASALRKVLQDFLVFTANVLETIERLESGTVACGLLMQRWKQIEAIVSQALK